MNDFIDSCDAAAKYPKNLISPGEYQHALQTYIDHLDLREGELFGSNEASLDFWDLDDEATGTCFSQGIGIELTHRIDCGRQISNLLVRSQRNWKNISTFRHLPPELIQDAVICKRNHLEWYCNCPH